jgi:hypothetical protein
MVATSSILLRIKTFSYKICRENQPNTYFMFNNVSSVNRAVYEMRKNTVQSHRPQVTILII